MAGGHPGYRRAPVSRRSLVRGATSSRLAAAGGRERGRGQPDGAGDDECEPRAAELDERAREERADRREADEREQVEADEPAAQVVGRGELDERVGVRGEERERGADADEDDPRQACLVHRGEREQEDAEPERPGRERPERRALERRGGERAGERSEAERRREEPERPGVDVQRVRGEERDEGVEVEADEPDARHDDEHGAHLPVAPGERAAPPAFPRGGWPCDRGVTG